MGALLRNANTNIFKEPCGKHSFKIIIFVTKMCDAVLGDISLGRAKKTTERCPENDDQSGLNPPYRGICLGNYHCRHFFLLAKRRPLLIQQEMVGKTVLRFITHIFSVVKGLFRRFNKGNKSNKNTQDKTSLPPQRHYLSRSPSSPSISSNAFHCSCHCSCVTSDWSIEPTGTCISGPARTLNEHG
ncbi:hypothetical protein V8B97DRAFT_237779 [Scleroderma yunnanense]